MAKLKRESTSSSSGSVHNATNPGRFAARFITTIIYLLFDSFIRPRYKIRGAPLGRCRVDIYYTLVLFYYRCTVLGYSNLFIGHLRLKHRGNVYIGYDMVEKIALQGRCWYQAKIKVTVFFSRILNHQKHKKIKSWNLWYKAIRALLNKTKLYYWRSLYCDGPV